MSRYAIQADVISQVLFGLLAVTPAVQQALRGGDPPASGSAPRVEEKEGRKTSYMETPAFTKGYRAAYTTIYDRNDYAAAINQLKALGHDNTAAVANLTGYSYRKLGDYKVSQIWYERALKTDPNHVKTWQYYGLWQVEQGNRDQAQYPPEPACSAPPATSSEEYRSLAAALDKQPGDRSGLLITRTAFTTPRSPPDPVRGRFAFQGWSEVGAIRRCRDAGRLRSAAASRRRTGRGRPAGSP